VMWAFYLGATVLLGSVLWTVLRTKEYAPKEYYAFNHMDADEVQKQQREKKSLGQRLAGFWQLVVSMPKTMKQLAVVQFFSWFALFIMWVYTMPAITQHIWGVEAKWFDPHYLSSLTEVPQSVLQAKGAAGDWVGILFAGYSLFAALFSIVLARLADKFGRKKIYAGSLLLGGLSYISFLLFNDPTPTALNFGFTEVTVPVGAAWLFLPMIGVGIAWAAILAMPYAMLAGALPANKTGVYMGIFNFTIAAPQIVSGIASGWILSAVFDNQAINIIMLAGVSMVLGALAVAFVKDQGQANEA